jgi:hypothetical protein
MKGWTDLGSDIDWIDYHGHWARRARDGSWFVIEWTNIYDAVGERDCKSTDTPQYLAEVRQVLPNDISNEQKRRALSSVGLDVELVNGELPRTVVTHDGHELEISDLMLVEALNGYGAYAPLESFFGRVHPRRIRAEARRAAEAFISDAGALEEALERPVNAIGSTAREVAHGDLDSALLRYQSGEGPPDPGKDLILKITGLPPRTPSGGASGKDARDERC